MRDETRIFLSGHGWKRITRTLVRARKHLKLSGELGVTFVQDDRMQTFGQGKTDVLAFPYDDNRSGRDIGDVFINVDYIKRIRKQSDWIPRVEELVVHALVHLAGHTHNTFTSYERMRGKERDVLGRPCLPPWNQRVVF